MMQSAMFAGAGVTTSLIAPFTIFIMGTCNGRLHELAATYPGTDKSEMTPSEVDEVRALLTQWIRLNYLRACFPLAGSILAALAPFAF